MIDWLIDWFTCLFIFDPDVLYNLENEIELLASMDIDHLVRNSTNNTVIESEVSLEFSDENTEPRENKNMQTKAEPKKLQS